MKAPRRQPGAITRVFVCGSLLAGGYNHRILGRPRLDWETRAYAPPAMLVVGGSRCRIGGFETYVARNELKIGYVGVSVQYAGAGSGTVISSSAGIRCTTGAAANCQGIFSLAQAGEGLSFATSVTSGTYKRCSADDGTIAAPTANPCVITGITDCVSVEIDIQ